MFKVIQKINTVLFLFILLGGAGLVVFMIYQSSQWTDRRAVEVKQSSGKKEKVEMQLGRLKEINGHDAHYVNLYSGGNGGKLSGYSAKEIQNMLFISGVELETKWLYENHNNLIREIDLLKLPDDSESVAAIFLNVVKQDTNGDGLLSNKDKSVIALISPDGTGYTELDNNISKVMDKRMSKDGNSVLLITQIDSKIVFKQYSVDDFSLIAKRVLTEISGMES